MALSIKRARAAQLQSRDTDNLNWSDFRLCDEKSRSWVASVFFGDQIYASGVGERRSVVTELFCRFRESIWATLSEMNELDREELSLELTCPSETRGLPTQLAVR